MTLRKTTKRTNTPIPKKTWLAKDDDDDDDDDGRRRFVNVSVGLSSSPSSSSRQGVDVVSFLDRSLGALNVGMW